MRDCQPPTHPSNSETPLIGQQILYVQYSHSHPLYPEDICIRQLWMRHGLVKGTRHMKLVSTGMNFLIIWKLSFLYKLETFLILRRTERDIIINVHVSSSRMSVIPVRFQWNLDIIDKCSKNIQISNFMQIRPVGAELFHADGQTDRQRFGQTWLSQ
jgi:hypothetical protein